jgi:hypothetical protein
MTRVRLDYAGIRAAYAANVSPTEIAERFGCHPKSIRRLCRDMPPQKPWSSKNLDRDGIRAAYMAGDERQDIADRYGTSTQTVDRYCSDLPRRRRPYSNQLDPAKIEQARVLLDDGCGYNEASRTTGLAYRTLTRHLPGYALSPSEVGVRGALGRKESQISTQWLKSVLH